MEKFQIKVVSPSAAAEADQVVNIIIDEGKVYQEVRPVESAIPWIPGSRNAEGKMEVRKKIIHRRKKRTPVEVEEELPRSGPGGGRGKGRARSEEALAIEKDILEGKDASDIAAKHGCEINKVYGIKSRMKKEGRLSDNVVGGFGTGVPNDKPKTFECYRGHNFKSSALKPSEASCPECGQRGFREIKQGDQNARD